MTSDLSYKRLPVPSSHEKHLSVAKEGYKMIPAPLLLLLLLQWYQRRDI